MVDLQFAYSHYTAQGPDVWFTAMTLLVEHFRGQVVGSAADSLPPVSRWLQLGSQTKVPDLQLHRLTHKEVTCREEREWDDEHLIFNPGSKAKYYGDLLDELVKEKTRKSGVGIKKTTTKAPTTTKTQHIFTIEHKVSQHCSVTMLHNDSLPSFRSLWRISCSCRYLSPETICLR